MMLDMDDYILMKLLLEGEDKHGLIDEFKEFMRNKSKRMRSTKMHDDYDYDDYSHTDRFPKSYRKAKMCSSHFDEQDAREVVSEMHHTEAGKIMKGEKFSMAKAEEILSKHGSSFTTDASVEDVYVAINATYHDLHSLFKTWFGLHADEKIVLTAITFWFKDEDYDGNKILDYFE